jgi:hypothetical protein
MATSGVFCALPSMTTILGSRRWARLKMITDHFLWPTTPTDALLLPPFRQPNN